MSHSQQSAGGSPRVGDGFEFKSVDLEQLHYSRTILFHDTFVIAIVINRMLGVRPALLRTLRNRLSPLQAG